MAKLTNGLFGNISGRVGNFIFYTRNGKTVVRMRSTEKRQISDVQQKQMTRFKLASAFLNGLYGLLKITYKESNGKIAWRNLFMAHLIRDAITGTSPDFSIDYSKVEMSIGTKLGGEIATAGSRTKGEIQFIWTNSFHNRNAGPDDRAILIAHCPELADSVYEFTRAERVAGAGILKTPSFKGKQVHAWIAFIDTAGNVSESSYAGSVAVL